MSLPKELTDAFVNDSNFRSLFLKDPQRAARRRGFELDPRTSSLLKNVDAALMSKMIQDATLKMAPC